MALKRAMLINLSLVITPLILARITSISNYGAAMINLACAAVMSYLVVMTALKRSAHRLQLCINLMAGQILS